MTVPENIFSLGQRAFILMHVNTDTGATKSATILSGDLEAVIGVLDAASPGRDQEDAWKAIIITFQMSNGTVSVIPFPPSHAG